MTDYPLSTFETATMGSKHHQSFGQRLTLWIETHQQRKADREIARVLARARN